jgi:hypothetical protein
MPNRNPCVGDWMKINCGDKVTEVDGCHEGRVQSIINSATVRVRWDDNGWISEFRLRDNALVNLSRQRRSQRKH